MSPQDHEQAQITESPAAASDNAVDDSDEADGDYVMLQKSLSQKKRAAKEGDSRLQKVLPFQFLPNIRPLTISDLESCIALENAAFPEPKHRATPEKVRAVSFPWISSAASGLLLRSQKFFSPSTQLTETKKDRVPPEDLPRTYTRCFLYRGPGAGQGLGN